MDTETEDLITIEKCEPRDSGWSANDEDPFLAIPSFDVNKIEPEDVDEDFEERDPLFQNGTEKSSKRTRKTTRKGKTKRSKRPAKSKKGRLKVRYVCPKCAKIFTHVRLFNEHVHSHDPENGPEKKHKCTYSDCSREFGSQIGLKNHMNYHSSKSESEGYKCFFCHEEFDSVEFLSGHIAESHEDIKDNDMLGHSYSSSMDRLLRNLKRKKWHTCDKCSKKFGNINLYKRHLKSHDSEKNSKDEEFKCEECSKVFFSNNSLRTHFKTSNCSNPKEKRRVLRKPTAKEENSEESDANDSNSSGDEENEKSSENRVQCAECPRQFSGVLKLDKHLVKIHQKVPKCSQCGKVFPNGRRLFRHQSVHKLPSFKCPHERCTAAFRTKEGLTVHRRRHDGILPHICKLCQKGFQTKPLCVQHRIDVHGENLKSLSGCSQPSNGMDTGLPGAEMNSECFTCQFCGKGSASKDALRLHLKRHHGKDIHGNDVGLPPKYPCTKPGCDAVYKDPSSLVIHARKHEGLPPYVCPVCQQGFANMRDWIDHRIDVHKENLTKVLAPGIYQCETCGNTYKYLDTLEKHVKRKHVGQKNLECDICNKKFSLKCDLRKHKICHTRVDSFMCEECGLSLSTPNGLRKHSILHKPHSERPFQCHICGHGFVEERHLVEHGKIHSGEKTYRRPRNSTEPKPKKIRIKKKREKKPKPPPGSGNDGKRQGKKYVCQVCTKNFHQKSNLVRHLTNVHGIEYQEPIKETPPPAETKYKKSSPLPPPNLTALNNVTNGISQLQPFDTQQQSYNDYNNSIPPSTSHYLHPYTNTGKEIADYMDNHITTGLGVEFSMEDLERSSPISIDHQPDTPDANVVCRQNEGQIITREVDLTNTSPNQHSVVNKQQDKNLETEGDTATKLEPSFESDMELDDFFESPSPEPVAQESSNELGILAKVKMEKSRASLISGDNLLQLSEKERQLGKKILGPRPRIPILKLHRLMIYPCKLCTKDFHRKDLYDSHCRSVRHWQAIRRIKYSETEEKSEIELDIKRKCFICNVRLDSVTSLALHHSFEHSNEKGFSCHLCGTAYHRYSQLHRHQIVDHNKKGDFQCVICKEKYSSYEVYRKHVKTGHQIELKCPLCEKSFTRVKKLDVHWKAKHRGEKFICDICSSSFSRYKEYRTHRSDVHNEVEFEGDSKKVRKPKRRFHLRGDCEICGKTFGNIREHRKIHSDEKNNLCHLCGKSFRKISQLIIHNQRHLKDARFPCSECPKRFYRPSDVRLHYQVHTHKYCCSICPRKFPTETRLKSHEGLHDPKRPFECTVCNYRFINISNLTAHVNKMHPGTDSCPIQDTTPKTSKPISACLICPYCYQEFSTMKERNEHKLTHPKEEQVFKCRKCPKIFRTTNGLSLHVQNHHSTVGEIQCKECGKIFSKLQTYHQHRQEHAEIARGVQSLCNLCGLSFHTKRKLRTHRCKSR